ncbi:hypothetical protein [Halorussus sp. AFM4]|uniref:hypothetical protein n=1 Tax=Halorussus sp. AFM4 TaxID=3421651 RepID=UPI003EBD0CF2
MARNGGESSNRREVLKSLGSVTAVLPVVGVATARTSSERSRRTPVDPDRNAQNWGEFAIWGADHLEIDYKFTAPNAAPIPGEGDTGAEVRGNDRIVEDPQGDIVYGRTGFGENDLWDVDRIFHLEITDARVE